jgi:hypothetical protein
MLGDLPTAEIGTPEWDAQVAESVRQQFAAQDLAWRQQFAPQTLPAATSATAGGQVDLFVLAGIGAAVWFLARSKPKRKRMNRR